VKDSLESLIQRRESGEGVLQVRVSTKASSNKIKIEQPSGGQKIVRVYVTAAPEGGKANKEVINLLSKHLKVPKSSLQVIQGVTSRNKTILLKSS